MAAWSIDGMDVLAVADACQRAATAVRAGGGPHFIELRTYRFRAHSMYDPELYRSKDEVELWKERDPIATHVARLRAAGALDDAQLAALEQEVESELARAVAFAESATLEPIADLERFVYAEGAAP